MNQVNILHHIVFVSVDFSFLYKIHSLSDDKRKDTINSLIPTQEEVETEQRVGGDRSEIHHTHRTCAYTVCANIFLKYSPF